MRRRGFTLTETVVALTLFAAAATALVQAAINAQEGLRRLEAGDPWHVCWVTLRAELLAITDRRILDEGGEIELARHMRKEAEENDAPEAQTHPVRARWEVEIVPTRVLNVHRLTMTAFFSRGAELTREHTASYYVYRPGWYEKGEQETLMKDRREEWERRRMERGW